MTNEKSLKIQKFIYEEIKYIENRLKNKSINVVTRQYLLGKLTGLESIIELFNN